MTDRHFKELFGLEPSQVRKTCVLMPFLLKEALREFKIGCLARGKLYGAGNSRDFTLIHSGLGPALTGDALLYLKDTGCKNVNDGVSP